jgi:hypothetical protein
MDLAILPVMDNTIGTAIAMLQAKLHLKGPAIAMLALGPASTATERRTFLNRLSKIKRSEKGAESPTVPMLEKIARGMGYSTLADFFTALGHTNFPKSAKNETNLLQPRKRTGKVANARASARRASANKAFLVGPSNAFDQSASATVDLSSAPPFDPRTRYTLWSVVVLLTKHLRASDAMADSHLAVRRLGRVQPGRDVGRAGKNPRR